MLTPQEITEKVFVKAVFGGYDMDPVDKFIGAVAKDYAELYKENAVLKNKLKVLVEKIEEYRTTEDAMRMALLTAQKMAKEITDEAEKKSRTMLEDAERVTHDKIEQYRAEENAERAKMAAVKAEADDYIARVKSALAEQVVFLERLENVAGSAKLAQPNEEEKTVDGTQDEAEKIPAEIEKSVAQMIEKVVNSVEEELAEDEAENDDTKVFEAAGTVETTDGKKTKFEFIDLQFGKDVDITK